MSYSIWKLVDGDEWWWNLNPREVRIDIFPSCNNTRVLLGLFAKISPGHWATCPEWASLQLGAPHLLSAKEDPEDGLCPWVCTVGYLYCTLRGFLVVLWLLPVSSARIMPEFNCGQFHGCESLFVLSADANVLMRVIKSQSRENSGDLLIKIAYLC